jgi:leucyl aminopeptidase (aminopeptidase T)
MNLNIGDSLRQAARVVVANVACLRKKLNVLIICGLHNKVFAESIALESYRVGAYPYLWVFDERLFVNHSIKVSQDVVAVLPKHTCSLVKESDIIVWLSQFTDIESVPLNIRRGIYSFWDAVHEAMKTKPRLLVNLPSAKYAEDMGIDYEELLHVFTDAVRVDYSRLKDVGLKIASKLSGRKLVHIYDSNGTDLVFKIEDRHVGVEIGTLEECFSSGNPCEVELPAGEVYVAPVENSANGILVIDGLKDYGIRGLELYFDKGRVKSFRAKKGYDVFRDILKRAEGDKDRIAEFGIGTNYGMKPVGWNLYDEKAFGTAHIAIGDNIHLGGVNKASIHIDFVLHSANITVDDELVMEKGKFTRTST